MQGCRVITTGRPKNLEKGELSKKFGACIRFALGYDVVGWDAEWRFKHYNIPIQSASKIVAKLTACSINMKPLFKNNIVVLMHDRMFATKASADSLRKVITLLKSDSSIVFETIDHYPLLQQNN